MPPNAPAASEASPCPTSSRSGSYRRASSGTPGMDAATRADSSDSMAASAATATAGLASSRSSPRLRPGSPGAGSDAGSSPMRATGAPISSAPIVTTATATSEPGTWGAQRANASMMSTTTATMPRVHSAVDPALVSEVSAVTSGFPPTGSVTPTAAGTCCRKMIVAMPRVNPSTTGHGMYVTTRPSRATPASSTIAPPMSATTGTALTPCSATIGASTTAIAPVGPDTCTRDPPNSAAMMPATTAVTSPAAGPTPELTPNASASGSATTPTVTPASRSERMTAGRSSKSSRRGSSPRNVTRRHIDPVTDPPRAAAAGRAWRPAGRWSRRASTAGTPAPPRAAGRPKAG